MDNIESKITNIKNNNLKYQLLSSYKTLNQVDNIIDYHNRNSNNSIKDNSFIVINIYGLLQSLFVGIDSLYSLVIGITNNKFNINVNQNIVLNGLKHIRNDIVGHPTNRRYGNDGVAYSIIDNSKLTYNLFKYDTYIFQSNVMNQKEIVVNLNDLKREYLKEKQIIMDRLKDYVSKDIISINLDIEIRNLFYNTNLENLNIVKNKFINNYGNLSNHRFIWRLNYVHYCLTWFDDDVEFQKLIEYITKQQINKMLEISFDMEKKKGKLPFIKLPNMIKRIYKYLDKNEELLMYINNLHDNNNPYFESDIDYLIAEVTDVSFLKVLNKIKQAKNNEIIYLLGSTIKNYKKK